MKSTKKILPISLRFQEILFLVWSGNSMRSCCHDDTERMQFCAVMADHGIMLGKKVGEVPKNFSKLTTDDLLNQAKEGICKHASSNATWAKLAIDLKINEQKNQSMYFRPEDYATMLHEIFPHWKKKGEEEVSSDNNNDKTS